MGFSRVSGFRVLGFSRVWGLRIGVEGVEGSVNLCTRAEWFRSVGSDFVGLPVVRKPETLNRPLKSQGPNYTDQQTQ